MKAKWFNEITARLMEESTTGQIAYYNNVVPGSKPLLGVKIPILRKMAKEIAKGDYEFFVRKYPEEYFEQETLKAFVIGYAKDELQSILTLAEEFVPKIHDWSVNDSFCQNFTIARKHREQVFSWLMKYVKSEREYEQRVVAVTLMSHFLVDDYYEQVLEVMNELEHPGYYTRMGVAWCVATAYAKYPEYTMNFLKTCRLCDWTYNKSIQKMLESYRVSDEDKILLRTMKRK